MTRKEWLERRDQLQDMYIALGPCPPEPPPEPFRKDECTLVRVSEGVGTAEGTLWVGIPGNALTADEADAMALALTECAAYIREQEAKQAAKPPRNAPAGPPSCGRVLVGQESDTWDPLCRRPRGHPGVCHEWWTIGDHARYAREQEAPTSEKWKGTQGTHSRHGAIAIASRRAKG
jgi:hypothetical protein